MAHPQGSQRHEKHELHERFEAAKTEFECLREQLGQEEGLEQKQVAFRLLKEVVELAEIVGVDQDAINSLLRQATRDEGLDGTRQLQMDAEARPDASSLAAGERASV